MQVNSEVLAIISDFPSLFREYIPHLYLIPTHTLYCIGGREDNKDYIIFVVCSCALYMECTEK